MTESEKSLLLSDLIKEDESRNHRHPLELQRMENLGVDQKQSREGKNFCGTGRSDYRCR